MWKRKSVTATVTETPVSEPPPPRSIRSYKITAPSSLERTFEIKAKISREVIYVLRFRDTKEWNILLQNPNEKIAAAATNIIPNNVTELALGDPTAVPDTSERIFLTLVSDWKHKTYDVTLLLPPTCDESESRVLELQWKGTHDVTKLSAKIDRGMHHKLIEKSTNRVLARYVHNFWNLDVGGMIEICADIPSIAPQHWDLFVLTSGMTIAERTIKLAMLKIYGVKDPPTSMAAGWAEGMAKHDAKVEKKRNAKVGTGAASGMEFEEAAAAAEAAGAFGC